MSKESMESAMAAAAYLVDLDPDTFRVLTEPLGTYFVVTVQERVESISGNGNKFSFWKTLDVFEVEAC